LGEPHRDHRCRNQAEQQTAQRSPRGESGKRQVLESAAAPRDPEHHGEARAAHEAGHRQGRQRGIEDLEERLGFRALRRVPWYHKYSE